MTNKKSMKQKNNSLVKISAHSFPADLHLYSGTPESTEQEPALTAHQAIAQSPTISILTPVYNVDPKWLELCVQSVICQTNPNWELILVDDGSTRVETLAKLHEYDEVDDRIVTCYQEKNEGISAATNAALALAKGEYVALLDNDDELTYDAIEMVLRWISDNPGVDFIYSDEDKLDMQGNVCEPFFKPDWSPELLHSYSYTCHLSVFKKKMIIDVGKFRSQFDGAQDFDITLRVSAKAQLVCHIPKILYHWRKITGSAADVVNAKGWALNNAHRALTEHIQKIDPGAVIKKEIKAPGCFRTQFEIKGEPLVSILIPTRGQINFNDIRSTKLLFQCVRSIENNTDYTNYEIVIAYNNHLDQELSTFFKGRGHRLINYPLSGQFNFAAKMNFMAREARGDYLVVFNDDLEVISSDWLTALLEFAQQPKIGAVGSRLLYPDGRLQHVGVILGINGYPAHVFHQHAPDCPGYMAHANIIRNYSAVTGAAMMVRKELFDQIHGFDEEFAIDYNDTDFCLRLGKLGYRIVYTPYSVLYHHESAALSSNRLNKAETNLFRARWKNVLENDPFYNPNLPKDRLDYGMENI